MFELFDNAFNSFTSSLGDLFSSISNSLSSSWDWATKGVDSAFDWSSPSTTGSTNPDSTTESAQNEFNYTPTNSLLGLDPVSNIDLAANADTNQFSKSNNLNPALDKFTSNNEFSGVPTDQLFGMQESATTALSNIQQGKGTDKDRALIRDLTSALGEKGMAALITGGFGMLRGYSSGKAQEKLLQHEDQVRAEQEKIRYNNANPGTVAAQTWSPANPKGSGLLGARVG